VQVFTKGFAVQGRGGVFRYLREWKRRELPQYKKGMSHDQSDSVIDQMILRTQSGEYGSHARPIKRATAAKSLGAVCLRLVFAQVTQRL
jgi:hypothetical protein